MSYCSSVDRAPTRCSRGHGFDSCRGVRFFLCPTLVSCWSIHLSKVLTCFPVILGTKDFGRLTEYKIFTCMRALGNSAQQILQCRQNLATCVLYSCNQHVALRHKQLIYYTVQKRNKLGLIESWWIQSTVSKKHELTSFLNCLLWSNDIQTTRL